MCHPFGKLRASTEAQPKDLANEKSRYIGIRFAQNDSFAVTLGTLDTLNLPMARVSSLIPLASLKEPKNET
jgi:hypothetical protein